ncbi:MAG: DNA polymerase III subunit epsilon [Alcanivorax borkumensis]|jgi:DNA polymerase-3 subunit epsilon|uniref:DNA polymerase III subunit epsilon n=1 Tax=Alcanivorax borkumensis (strain ATCC 700651 / DSM 11573 / NCIMB 13689 / SK2) TaxID=393595 RepID=Q0VQ75_ALCBS|nr:MULTISPECIES: DNA polymerase III subunit epsilon [Alcanivorax]OJH07868.1 MAG: DNA polymerase III subunit epsilon [Alcanivorax borkumensis]EUC71336.1 DNA polymerase III subunit epsilon [Alcanivorax sp. 97CO-5]PKG02767.1 DNA polymerase III subunit epsilon [Alcanivorax sp. 97CO-6]CAL16673.1 DNA polymerase III, epsilon subunit [Alcanivorax borkumensis SK2]BAP14148.1 DNA polymerase III subunit epsilon [Alcanivorax sp. NBRC 101098]
MRQVVLDTETTGLEPNDGHRVIEIGCVEMENRRLTGNSLHLYLNPEREIDAGALAVHGISSEFLADKPTFDKVVDEFLAFVDGAELVIHNAPFDVGFLNHELRRLGTRYGTIEQRCGVLDTLVMARQKHPGQKNSLDALCRRYFVENGHRELHGALLDAEILADVYLAMTGGQTRLFSGGNDSSERGGGAAAETIRRLSADRVPLCVVRASENEQQRHRNKLAAIAKKNGVPTVWQSLGQNSDTPLQ